MMLRPYVVLVLGWAVALAGGCTPALRVDEFLAAVAQGDQGEAGRLLADQPQLLRAADAAGRTALHMAVAAGQVEMVDALLWRKADARARDADGRTPIRLAAEGRSEPVATRLLLNIPDIDLERAAEEGDADGVALVVAVHTGCGRSTFPLSTWDPLEAAARRGHAQVVRILLAAGADAKGHEGFGALHAAATEGHADAVKVLLDAGTDVNTVDDYNRSGAPLHQAAGGGHLEVIDLLVRAGADVNGMSRSRGTPLHEAALFGHTAAVRRLIEAGAAVDLAAPWGYRPIHNAVWAGHGEVVRLLRAHGAETDILVAASMGETDEVRRLWGRPLPEAFWEQARPEPLVWAARGGQIEVARMLLARGANVNAWTRWNETVLQAAAEAGQADMVTFLLQKGADVNDQGGGGRTPLHEAAREGHIEVARRLLAAGAMVDGESMYAGTALHVAARNGKTEVVQLLVGAGADIEKGDECRETPLQNAVRGGHPGVCRFLVDKGARLWPGNADKDALRVALGENQAETLEFFLASGQVGDLRAARVPPVSRKHVEVTRALLDAGVRLDPADNDPVAVAAGELGDVEVMRRLLAMGLELRPAKDIKGSPRYRSGGFGALHTAVSAGRKDMVRFLLACGVDPNDADRHGQTALACAIACSNKPAAVLLCDAGARINARRGSGGGTGLMGAAGLGYEEMVRVLLARGAEVNAVDAQGRTALDAALRHRDYEWGRVVVPPDNDPIRRIVELLVAWGADLQHRDTEGLAPLHHAVLEQRWNLARWFLSKGAEPDIFSAAALGLRDRVESLQAGSPGLLSAGKAPIGQPLSWAAHGKQQGVVEVLLARGANVHARAHTGRFQNPPLYWAVRSGDAGVVRLLLEHGADPGARATPIDIRGSYPDGDDTLLHTAVVFNRLDVARLLLEGRADPNAVGIRGRTPLHVAAHLGLPDMARLLADFGANPVAPAADRYSAGITPIDLATMGAGTNCSYMADRGPAPDEAGRRKVARFLLERYLNADTPQARKVKGVALCWAAGQGDVALVQRLLDAGADINARDDDKQTPLVCAMERRVWEESHTTDDGAPRRYLAVMRLLLSRGADVTAGDDDHNTAESLAGLFHDKDVLELLSTPGSRPPQAGLPE
ncbi:MAG TPA: ankyrin repeat domain-containing protein [Phycisphaerae bacterium]|nr:ankyrin repeat domain-containing protein [Phycisphaerae bacterium]